MELFGYTDGACSHNPGPGGWAWVLLAEESDTTQKPLASNSHGIAETTNNRMELTAIMECMQYALTVPNVKFLKILSDSNYAVMGINKWLSGWVKRKWTKADGKQVLNPDLWERIYTLKGELKQADITLHAAHIPAHKGHYWNEFVDKMAGSAIHC